MKGLTIDDRDDRGVLTFDLKDILRLVGERVLRSHWKLTDVEALGEDAADEIHQITDSNNSIEGRKLTRLADGVWQIVDGRFEAYDEEISKPWLIITAVDSTAYDVQSEDESLLECVRTHFKSVRDLPASLPSHR